MNKKELNYKAEVKKGIISKKIFDQEIALCKKLSKENNGHCQWGRCKDCGVVPFLYKLYKGRVLEDSKEIKKLKENLNIKLK